MCLHRSSRKLTLGSRTFRVDGCLHPIIVSLNREYAETLGCCCGHGRYPKTIVIKKDNVIQEYFSGVVIPRTRRFYRTDKDGYYYIPELSEPYVGGV